MSSQYATDQTLFIGTDKGVYKSDDGGESWINVGLSEYQIMSLAISPSFQGDKIIFAGTLGNGIFMSTEGGYQ